MMKRALIVITAIVIFGLAMSTLDVEGAGDDVRERELKHQLDHALFTRHWRRPDRTGWVAKPFNSYNILRFDSAVYLGLDQAVLFETLESILRRQSFDFARPRNLTVTEKGIHFEKESAYGIGSPLFLPFLAELEIRESFSYRALWKTREEEIADGVTAYEIDRACLAKTNFDHDRRLWGVSVTITAGSRVAVIEQCLTEALYVAHGVVDARSPYRDTALNVLMHPAVENGMSKEELYRLIDDGVIDSEAVLAPPAEIRELDLSRR